MTIQILPAGRRAAGILLAGGLVMSMAGPVSAAPSTIARSPGVTADTEFGGAQARYYGRPRYARQYRRGYGYGGAAALGIIGLGAAAAIAASRNSEYYGGGDYYYGNNGGYYGGGSGFYGRPFYGRDYSYPGYYHNGR